MNTSITSLTLSTYTVTSVSVDKDGYIIVSLINSVGNYGGILTDYPAAPHYYMGLTDLKVGDTIKL